MIKSISYKQDLPELLEETASRLLQVLDSFSRLDINMIPFENSWTAAQVADHLTRSNMSITKALLIRGTTINRDPGEKIQELKNVFLNFETRFKSPEFILPTQDIYEKETVIGLLKRSIEKMEEASTGSDLSEMINHPAFGDITKFEILHFVLYHTQRHIHQLENIFEAVKNR
ncbi:MAG TPA: DinB family protein [Chitinophagaceae bacterium]